MKEQAQSLRTFDKPPFTIGNLLTVDTILVYSVMLRHWLMLAGVV